MTGNTIYQFFRAVFVGAMAGSAVLYPFSIPIGVAELSSGRWEDAFGALLIPFVATLGVTLTAATVIGIPVTLYLARNAVERRTTYTWWGLVCGALIPIAVFHELILVGFLLAIPGMIAGAVTGHFWGKFREALQPGATPDHVQPNPIHDLLF